ncbi:TPA: IS30 family transposase [Enterococcus faecalis]
MLFYSSEKVKTISSDRRKEFSKHLEVTNVLKSISFYFSDPHAPWQRGTNENTNGLLRKYFPKNKEIDTVPDSYIEQTILKLNLRPRKCLNWNTPHEVFFDKTLHLI